MGGNWPEKDLEKILCEPPLHQKHSKYALIGKGMLALMLTIHQIFLGIDVNFFDYFGINCTRNGMTVILIFSKLFYAGFYFYFLFFTFGYSMVIILIDLQ